MSNAVVAPTYKKVIEDVLKNVADEFESLGIDESVLSELKHSWESKLLNSKVANFEEEFSETLHRKGQWNGLDNDNYDEESGKPRNDVNEVHVISSDDTPASQDQKIVISDTEESSQTRLSLKRPAEDLQNGTTETVQETDANRPADSTTSPNPPAKRLKTGDEKDSAQEPRQPPSADPEEDDADAINSDLDDSDEEEEANEADEGSGDIVLCQYDKVNRVKTKWKCSLKDGIVNIDGRDFLFHKANCDFQW